VQSLKAENAELRQRLDKLSSEMEQIKGVLADKGGPLTMKPAAKPVTSAFDIKLYGLVKLDAAYDDSRVNVGNFGRWVETESVLKNDEQFNLTANQTRLGMDIIKIDADPNDPPPRRKTFHVGKLRGHPLLVVIPLLQIVRVPVPLRANQPGKLDKQLLTGGVGVSG
jgi:hypothetical protein